MCTLLAAGLTLLALSADPTLTVTLTGTVRDARESLVAGAQVEVSKDGERETLVATAETDARGTFRLPDLRLGPGAYIVRAYHPERGRMTEHRLEIGPSRPPPTIEVQLTLGPAPAYRIEMPAGEAREEPPANYSTVTVFYATDRKPTGDAVPARFYGSERGADEALAYGSLAVSIPRHHEVGELEAPSIWRLEFRPDPERHVVLLSVLPRERDAFYRELAGRIQQSAARQAFVFVHGYNVSFEDAARRTAQIAYDLKIDAAPILYSWPSAASTTGYLQDGAAVEWSAPHLRRFLEEVAARSGATTVHLIAHSMGNRALTRALQMIAESTAPERPRPRFKQVVLAAPDIDAGVFRQLAASLTRTAERVTLYASSQDEALALSKRLHGYPRAGDSGDGIVIVDGVDTIDASGVETEFLGHSYYGDSPTVLGDLLRLLQEGVPPAARRLVRVPRGEAAYWRLGP